MELSQPVVLRPLVHSQHPAGETIRRPARYGFTGGTDRVDMGEGLGQATLSGLMGRRYGKGTRAGG